MSTLYLTKLSTTVSTLVRVEIVEGLYFQFVVIKYTKHVYDKLKLPEIVKLKINLKTIDGVLNNPTTVDKSIEPHQSIGILSKILSLSVIWKVEGDIITVITFYPAKKGRYESKILRRR